MRQGRLCRHVDAPGEREAPGKAVACPSAALGDLGASSLHAWVIKCGLGLPRLCHTHNAAFEKRGWAFSGSLVDFISRRGRSHLERPPRSNLD